MSNTPTCPKCGREYERKRRISYGDGEGIWYIHDEGDALRTEKDECYVDADDE